MQPSTVFPFSSPPRPDRLWGSTYLLSNGKFDVLSLRLKRPGREADHLPPYSVEVKNAWSYTSTPPYIFMAWCLIKHRTHLHGMVLSQAPEQLCLTSRCPLHLHFMYVTPLATV